MTVSFHKYGDQFFPGTGDAKVIFFIPFVSLVVPISLFYHNLIITIILIF